MKIKVYLKSSNSFLQRKSQNANLRKFSGSIKRNIARIKIKGTTTIRKTYS